MPEGIKWPAVPLPCLTKVFQFVGFEFSLLKQGSGHGRGRSPVEWGDFPSICLSVRLFVRPSVLPPPSLAGRPSDQAGRPSDQAGRPSDLAGSWIGLRPGWESLKASQEERNGCTDGRTENLPILQDFVPNRGRCPASTKETQIQQIGKLK